MIYKFDSENKQKDILQTEGINSKGFGTIPKLVMTDKRLTAQAKAIYSYFASYAGAGQIAFPKRTKILTDLGMGINTYYRHFALLKRYGYIKVEQEKGKGGQFKRNLYTLMNTIPLVEPCTKNEDTEPCRYYPYTDRPYTDNGDTNINSIINTNNIKNKQSCLSCQSEAQQTIEQKIDRLTDTIHENIEYEIFKSDPDADIRLIDEIVSIIVDVMVSDSPYVRVDAQERPRALVQHVLMELTFERIELVVEQFKAQGERITKKRQYILTMLYNARHELNAHNINTFASDL